MVEIEFVGIGAACDPQQPNTSVLYRGKATLLLDCGFSVPAALWKRGLDPSELDGIVLSHQHADHTFGVPALVLWMQEAGRKRTLRIFGGRSLLKFVGELIELGYPGLLTRSDFFGLELIPLDSNAATDKLGLRFRAAPSQHNEQNVAVRVDGPGGSFCYSGDGSTTVATRELYRGADLVVHECYSTDVESSNHAAARVLVPELMRQGIGQVFLVHVAVGQHDRVREFLSDGGFESRFALAETGQCVFLR